jgi:DNA-damage-inducible protein J
MGSNTTNISIRLDTEIKKKAEKLFSDLGMNMTTAFNIFLRQSIREGKIPFEISLNLPNAETVAALIEAENISRDPNVRGFKNMEDLIKELNT